MKTLILFISICSFLSGLKAQESEKLSGDNIFHNFNRSHVRDMRERAQTTEALRASLLFEAFKKNDMKELRMLLKETDPNAKNFNGESLLHEAAAKGNIEVLKLLKEEYQLDINLRNKNGYTALHYASNYGQKESVEWLILHGAEMDLRDKVYRETALHLACRHNYLDIIKYMVQKGANINLANKAQESPLMTAMLSSNPATLRFLIDHGADLTKLLSKKNKESFLYRLSQLEKREMKQILVERMNLSKRMQRSQRKYPSDRRTFVERLRSFLKK